LHRAPNQIVASQRARWLAELAETIEQAQKLAWRLGVAEGDSDEARDLHARLGTVRAEVDSLRSGDWVDLRREIRLAWLERLLPDGVNLPSPRT
jgi:hypothetical protein